MASTHAGNWIVVKLGGASDVVHDGALDDLAALWRPNARFVLVHGGSAETNALSQRVGKEPEEIISPSGHRSRRTDAETRDVFTMATALVNRRLVGALQRRGVPAFGLSGLDGGTLRGRRKDAIRSVANGRVRVIRDDWSGRIECVDTTGIRALSASGHLPVVAPLAMATGGEPLNVDGDRAAASLAAELHANTLVLLTGASGVYRSFPDESTRIERATLSDHESLLEAAEGRMKRKVVAAREALVGGVERVIIAASAGVSPITAALHGNGTVIRRAAEVVG